MRAGIVSFTLKGSKLSKIIRDGYPEIAWSIYQKEGESSLSEFTHYCFQDTTLVIFIGACGIAVRSIAPFVTDKFTDPAILVMDEKGEYVIPILSGHVGGANEWAKKIAECVGGKPVITTATDVQNVFAVDVFARKNRLLLTNRVLAKDISASLLTGAKVGIYLSNGEWGHLPDGLIPIREKQEKLPSLNIAISSQRLPDWLNRKQVLHLIPRTVVVGIGCQKEKESVKVIVAVRQALHLANICPDAVCKVTSIDRKKKEEGILQFSQAFDVPYITYSALELSKVQGDFFHSDYVQSVTGVDNVCERAAVLGARTGEGEGELILGRQTGDGVTVALAKIKRRIVFE